MISDMKPITFSFPWKGLYSLSMIFLMLIIGVSLVSCSEASNLNEEEGMIYEVNAPSQLIVRTQPSKTSEKILSLPDKSIVHVDAIENGWAHVVSKDYDGYVNAEYITEVAPEPRNSYSKVEEKSSGTDIKEIGSKSLPYVVLVISIIALILICKDEDEYLIWLLLLMSLAELGYIVCMYDHVDRFWFLESDEVGWLMVIVNYLITFGILIFQGVLVLGAISESSSGWFNGILNFGLSLFAGMSIYGLIFYYDRMDIAIVGLACLCIAGLIGVLYYSLRDWPEVLKMVIINSIVVPVYIGVLLSMLMLIIFVVLALIVVGVVGGGYSPSSRSHSTIRINSGNNSSGGISNIDANEGKISGDVQVSLANAEKYRNEYEYYRQKAESALRDAEINSTYADDEANKASLYDDPSYLDKEREYRSWAIQYRNEAKAYAEKAERYRQLAEDALDTARARM